MIITRTPFRVSFFGGGTDYPVWWREHGGAVLATTLDYYCYITCAPRLPFYDYEYLVSWSKNETVNTIAEIEHPAVRELFRYMSVEGGMDIRTAGELPARAGLGASSAFTVGLLHAIYAMRGEHPSKMQLATEAIHVEQNLIREHVGCQDQTMAAFGGLNRVSFATDGNIEVAPVDVPADRLRELEDSLLLVFTDSTRTASEIAQRQIEATPRLQSELGRMQEMVDEGARLLRGGDLADFGRLLNEGWLLKRSLTPLISSSRIDEIYDAARESGAIGGKISGAGGGGFMLLFVPLEARPRVKERLKDLILVDVRFESKGSQVVFRNNNVFDSLSAGAEGQIPSLNRDRHV